jgi:hypothetical protein
MRLSPPVKSLRTSPPPQERPAGSFSDDRTAFGLSIAIAVAAVAARLTILARTGSGTEDFYITLRYAENLASGAGFVYNLHERVLGTTTPLYTLLLALASLLSLDAALFGKTLNLLADGATCLLMARLMARLGRPLVGCLAALLYATASTPISVTIGGMETGLVTLAGLGAIYAYAQRKPITLYLSLALLALLRIDGLLLAGIVTAGWVWRERQIPWKALLIGLAVVLPWVIFATAYFGSPVPTSLQAKLAVYDRLRPEALPNLSDLRHQFLGGAPQKTLFLLALLGAWIALRAYPPLRAPLVWLLLYYGTILFSKVPAFAWYFLPPLPLYYLLVGLGMAALFRQGFRLWRLVSSRHGVSLPPTRARAVALTLLALTAFALCARLPGIERDIAAAQALEDTVRRPLGQWLAQHTETHERVMLEPIGYIGYYSRRPILDIIGLVSPEVLACYQPHIAEPLGEMIRRFHPDLLLLREGERSRLTPQIGATGEPILNGEYQFVRAFPAPPAEPIFYLYRRGKR